MDNAAPPLAPIQNPSPNAGPGLLPPPAPSKGMSGCLKALLIVAGFLALCMLVVGILVWQVVSWFSNMVQPTPMKYPPLMLGQGEQEDVQRIMQGLTDAKQKGMEFDEYVTPQVFNGTLERILQGERDKGRTDVPLGVRAGFAGTGMKLEISAVADQKQLNTAGKQNATIPYYVNGEAEFTLEIVEGEPKTIDVQRLSLGGRDAPAIILWFVRAQIGEFMKHKDGMKADGKNPLGAIKLLKREGDRLHLILDGKKMPD